MDRTMLIRRAGPADVPAVLRLFDECIAWFVEIGNTGQWGSEPWSTQDRQVSRVTEACACAGCHRTPGGLLWRGSGALVRYSESCGYTRVGTFDEDGWPGQLLARSLGR